MGKLVRVRDYRKRGPSGQVVDVNRHEREIHNREREECAMPEGNPHHLKLGERNGEKEREGKKEAEE